MTEELVFWRRLDCPGHEAARLTFHDPFWHLSGTAVFADEGQPCRLEYVIACSAAWHTLRASVSGWVGRHCVRLNIVRDPTHRWRLNGRPCGDVDGCADLDLGFSPSTNMLPIRRLRLSIGQRAEVTAAWLRFPELTLGPLAQSYLRVDERLYRYEALAGRFAADLEVNPVGMVVRYSGRWEAES